MVTEYKEQSDINPFFNAYYPKVNPDTVLHYFSTSPFYDRTSDNEKLRQRNLGLDRLRAETGI